MRRTYQSLAFWAVARAELAAVTEIEEEATGVAVNDGQSEARLDLENVILLERPDATEMRPAA